MRYDDPIGEAVQETVDELHGREPKLTAADHHPEPGDPDCDDSPYDHAPEFTLVGDDDEADWMDGGSAVSREDAEAAIQLARESWDELSDDERLEAYGLIGAFRRENAAQQDAEAEMMGRYFEEMEQLGYDTDLLGKLIGKYDHLGYDGALEKALNVLGEEIGPTSPAAGDSYDDALNKWERERRALR